MPGTTSAGWAHLVRSAAAAGKPSPPVPAAPLKRNGGRRIGVTVCRRPVRHEAAKSPARDLRLLPAAGCAWAAAAVTIRLDAQAGLLLGLMLALGALTFVTIAVCSRNNSPVVLMPLVALAAAAMVSIPTAAHVAHRSSAPLAAAIAAQTHITVNLRATSDAQEISADAQDGAPRWILEADLLEGTSGGFRFTADTPVIVLGGNEWSSVKHGDQLRTAGKPLATDPGDRAGALLIASTSPDLIPEQPGAESLIEELRERFLALSASTGAPDDGLMPGMVIGARASVSQQLVDTMKATGLTHLTAVSGANCSYVLAFVFILCRACRLPRWTAAVAGITALVGFVLLVRPGPSVLRAAVMGAIGVLAVLTGRGRLSMTLLFLSIAALLTVDPWLSVEYAFILSVAATCGLVLVGPLLASQLGAFLAPSVAQLVAVPLAAQLFCSPVLALIQPSLPTYSLPANIAASPLVPFITIAGMVSVVLVALAPGAALPFALGAAWAAAGVAQIARFFAAAPHASIPWPSGTGGALLSALGSAVVLAVVVRGPDMLTWVRATCHSTHARIRARGAPPMKSGRRGGRLIPQLTPVAWVAAGCIAGVVGILVWNGVRGHGPEDWTVAACDVGQGDGLAVRTGPGSAIVFDAGPEAGPMDACLDHLRVDTVDLLVLTHLHEDHYGGVAGVFADRSVSRLLYSTTEETLPESVQQVSAHAGTTVAPATAGTAGTTGDVEWSVLWPAPGNFAASENDASAVVLATVHGRSGTSDLRILFTGDLEEDAANRLLRDQPALSAEGIDVLKVAHHGARNGGTAIIESLSPRVALISAGRRNDYGHPHQETLAALEGSGAYVARTDLAGTILIRTDGDSLQVRGSR